MKQKQLKQLSKITLGLTAMALFTSGTYNTFVLNSKSFMKSREVKFVKRLDEIQGEVKVAQNNWNDLASPKIKQEVRREIIAVKKINENNPSVQKRKIQKKDLASAERKIQNPITQENVKADPIIKQRLDLKLASFFNTRLYKAPLKGEQFEGSLYTNDGMIESLEVSLPEGKSINIAYSEMQGNIFTYELNGELYSGMIYEAGKGNYMVNLTNGPYADTRMKFMGEEALTDPNRDIANKAIKVDEDKLDQADDYSDEELDKEEKRKELADDAVDNYEENYNDEAVASEGIIQNEDEVEF